MAARSSSVPKGKAAPPPVEDEYDDDGVDGDGEGDDEPEPEVKEVKKPITTKAAPKVAAKAAPSKAAAKTAAEAASSSAGESKRTSSSESKSESKDDDDNKGTADEDDTESKPIEMSLDRIIELANTGSKKLRKSLMTDQIFKFAFHPPVQTDAEKKEIVVRAVSALQLTAFIWNDTQSSSYVESAIVKLASHTGLAETKAPTGALAAGKTVTAEVKAAAVKRRAERKAVRANAVKREVGTSAIGPLFIQAFAAGWIKIIKTNVTAEDRQCYHERGLHKLWRWLALLLRAARTQDIEGLSKALPTLIAAHVTILDRLQEEPYFHPRALSLLSSLLKRHPQLIAYYAKVIIGDIRGTPVTQWAILSHLAKVHATDSIAAGELAKLRVPLLKHYDEHILGAREPIGAFSRTSFDPLLSTLTHEEMATTLLPTLTRMLKRQPDLVLVTALPLFNSVTIDVSRYVTDLLPLILPEMKHGEAVRRDAAAAVVAVLVRKSSDPTVLGGALQLHFDWLMGKKDAISIWQARACFLQSIESFGGATAAGSSALRKISEDAVTGIATYLNDKESAAEAREVAVRVLSRHLTIIESVPDKALALLVNGIKGGGKDAAVISAYLSSLITIVTTWGDIRAGDSKESKAIHVSDGWQRLAKTLTETATVDALVKHIEAGVAKPAVNRRTGLAAIALLLLTSSRDIQLNVTAGKLTKLLLPIFKTAGSFFNSADLISKCSEDEVVAQSSIIATFIRDHWSTIRSEPAASWAPFFESLVRLTVHTNAGHRRRALAAIAPVIGRVENGDVIPRVITAFVTLFDAAAATPTPPPADIWSHALLYLAPRASPSSIAWLALVSHDARLATSTHDALSLWHKLSARWSRIAPIPSLNTLLTEQATAISELILSDAGIRSADEQKQATAIALAVTIASGKAVPRVLFDTLLPGILRILDAPELFKLSDYDVAVYNTAEGNVCNYAVEGEYKAQIAEQKNIRHARGGGYKAEDEAWERKTRAELAQKAGESKAEKDRQAKLDAESVIRGRVAVLAGDIDCGLRVVAAWAKHCSEQLRSLAIVPLLLPRLNALLRHRVTDDLAAEAHQSLAACLDKQLADYAPVLAAAVQAIIRQGISVYDDEELGQSVPFASTLLARITAEHGAFSASSFQYLFPLLSTPLLASGLVEDKEAYAAIDDTLNVLAAHCLPTINGSGVTVRYPSTEMVTVLLHVLARVPELKKHAHSALLRLCPALQVTELTHLIGDAGLLSPAADVRLAVLTGLQEVTTIVAPFDPLLIARLWIVVQDPVTQVAEAARALWSSLEFELTDVYADALVPLFSHREQHVRSAAGLAIAAGALQFPATVTATVTKMITLFKQSPDTVIESKLGVRQEKEYIYRWPTRSGVAMALGSCVKAVGKRDLLVTIFTFMVETGLADEQEAVWEHILQSGLKLIEAHGDDHVDVLLPIFEKNLVNLTSPAPTPKAGAKKAATKAAPVPKVLHEGVADRVREGVVVFMGTIARYLPHEDPKIATVMDSLLEVMKTPSHSVQTAVGDCIAPLMISAANEAERLVGTCMERLATGEDFGVRKGAAFGLAGMIKGLRLSALKRFDVLETLSGYVQDKGNAKAREGGMFAYERLFYENGSHCEPYVKQILPHLLVCFGDSNADVREATQEAAQVIMAHLTGNGVKAVLPIVLKALEEKAWRAKVESIGLLGTMAYCAPKQLSSCLPMIVPRLLDVMVDPSKQVQEASRNALKQIGSVIRNPEIVKIAPALLSALYDPANTTAALQALVKTSFVHSVDPPSLALIIPIIKRGLRDRLSTTKKMAAQVVGCMCSLIADVKDLLPYANTLLKYLKLILVDPIPEVRQVAAKALGAIYAGLGEAQFEGLLEWLLTMLKSDTNSVQRSGAAMGLAQVLVTLGVERTQALLPDLIEQTKHKENVVREGYLGLFVHLPEAFGQDFAIFLEDVLPVVLESLADAIGLVREAALKAGQTLVTMFAKSNTDLLLPALETGLRDMDWRIRCSACQLLGTMFLRLAGVSGKLFVGDTVEDDTSKETATITNRKQEQLIEDVLGTDRRNLVYATVYLMRSDVMMAVKNMAWRVWKAIVHVTPRMLTEILPTLMNKIIYDLASPTEERQIAAGSALGELVGKMGDSVLQQIIPILQERLRSPDGNARQGVCLGLAEVMASARKQHISAYMVDLIAAVRDALCDELKSVRVAAGRAFNTLFGNVGTRAVDEIVPSLLDQLDKAADDTASATLVLEGIREILRICSKDVVPYLVPQLVVSPMSVFHARALAALSDVMGSGFHRYVQKVAECLVEGMTTDDVKQNMQMREAGTKIVLCITQESVHTLLEALTGLMSATQSTKTRTAAAQLIAAFCESTQCNFDSHLNLLFLALLNLYSSEEEDLQEVGIEALETVIKMVAADKLMTRIPFVRSVIRDLVFNKRTGIRQLTELPGLRHKKGLSPLLPIYQHGLLTGTPDIREQAAAALGELIELSPQKSLAPFVIKITGPLIRIVGDRFPPPVKAAILHTLGLLIGKSGIQVKPFLPQLQATFIKALQDSSELVRARGGAALADLMTIHNRVDSVLTELTTNARSQADIGIKTSIMQALVGIIVPDAIGVQVTPPVIAAIRGLALEASSDEKDSVRIAGARCLGAAMKYVRDAEAFAAGVRQLCTPSSNWLDRDGRLAAIRATVEYASANITADQLTTLVTYVVNGLKDDNLSCKSSAMSAAGRLMCFTATQARLELTTALATGIAPLANDDVTQVRIEACAQLQYVGENTPEGSLAATPVVASSLLARVGDSNGPARLAAQRALYWLLQFHRGPAAANSTTLAVTKRISDKEETETLVNFCKKTLSKARFAEEAKEEEAKRLAAPLTAATPASEFKEEKDYTVDQEDDEEEEEEEEDDDDE